MLDYEWGNPAVMLFSSPSAAAEESAAQGHPPHHQPRQIFPHYDRSGLDLSAHLFAPPDQVNGTTEVVAAEEGYSLHHYGLSLPPAAPEEPPSATRIGLNLGVRTYFSSTPDGELMRLGRNVYRRSSGGAAAGFGAFAGGGATAASATARCQAEGCVADLTRTKHYYRRHKVCEFHSKAAVVVAHGLTQRFCQQCSRFHVLSEFDQGKRSCRKRLADHNRRRRKTQPPLPSLLPPPPPPQQRPPPRSPPPPPPQYYSSPTTTSTDVSVAANPSVEGRQHGIAASATSPTRMALGRSFLPALLEGAVASFLVPCGAISSSPSSCSSSSRSSSSSVFPPPHVGDLRRIPMSIWDVDADADEHPAETAFWSGEARKQG